jgi:hypothetical protein
MTKCYCVASVTKTFTLKGVKTIHCSTISKMNDEWWTMKPCIKLYSIITQNERKLLWRWHSVNLFRRCWFKPRLWTGITWISFWLSSVSPDKCRDNIRLGSNRFLPHHSKTPIKDHHLTLCNPEPDCGVHSARDSTGNKIQSSVNIGPYSHVTTVIGNVNRVSKRNALPLFDFWLRRTLRALQLSRKTCGWRIQGTLAALLLLHYICGE